jgi:IS30 family transposase
MNFALINENDLKKTEQEINQLPRRILGYVTPADLKQKIAA